MAAGVAHLDAVTHEIHLLLLLLLGRRVHFCIVQVLVLGSGLLGHARFVEFCRDAAVVARAQRLGAIHHFQCKLLLLALVEGGHVTRLLQHRVVEAGLGVLLYVVEVD